MLDTSLIYLLASHLEPCVFLTIALLVVLISDMYVPVLTYFEQVGKVFLGHIMCYLFLMGREIYIPLVIY